MAIIECGPGCKLTGSCGDRQVTYAGAVLATYECNGASDSDFVAIVWDADAGTVRHVTYASTAYWTYHNSAKVDATPDVIAAAMPGMVEALTERFVADAGKRVREMSLHKGRRVRSVVTRGKNAGVTGEIRWIGPDRYRRGVTRFGIACPGESTLRFLADDQIEPLDVEPLDLDAIRERATREVAAGRWRV